jgi:hypothetical protein
MEWVDGDGSKTDWAAAFSLRQTLNLSLNFTEVSSIMRYGGELCQLEHVVCLVMCVHLI